MKTLIVTGGMGSGKSVVCRHLEDLGIPVYDSDSRTKILYMENPILVYDIEEALGGSFRDGDGHLDRKKLGDAVFSDKEKLSILEDVVHPFVFKDFIAWRNERFDEYPFVVMESAIFMDRSIFHSLATAVMLVDAPKEIRVERACRRDGVSGEEVLARMNAQRIDPSLADVTIINDGDIPTLIAKVDEALEILDFKTNYNIK